MSHDSQPPHGRIVVGVDGSSGSRVALRWAIDEARLRHADLDVVMAWHEPYAYGHPMYGYPMLPTGEMEAAMHARLDGLLDGEHRRTPDVVMNGVLVQGPAAPRLLEAAKGADLLVVGSRGWGEFRGMILGSVSQHCVGHAECAVVVVHSHD